MTEHYNCGGTLVEQTPGNHVCKKCGNVVRTSVVNREESFRRVAESEGPATDIAKAALEGIDHD